jgi:hypothetical protein
MPEPPPAPKSFPRFAATASWCAPILVLVLAGVVSLVNPAIAKADQHRNFLILGIVSCLLILIGWLCGILALTTWSKQENKRVLAPALTGTVLNGLVILSACVFGVMKLQARMQRNAETVADIRAKAAEINAAAEKEMATNGTNRGLVVQKLQGLEKSMEDAAQNFSGGDALAAHATADFVKSLTQLKIALDTNSVALTSAKVLVASNIQDKADLELRRKVLQNFLAANDELKLYVQHGAEHYQEDLTRWHVPETTADAVLRGYRKRADAVNPMTVKVRECDGRIGRAMLGIVELEETNWGTWHVSATSGAITFDDTENAAAYNGFLKEIRTASAAEKKAEAAVLAASRLNP